MAILAKSITQLLSTYPVIKLAILFGSQASGKATPNSDIDLALLANEPLTSDFKRQLIEEIGVKFGQPIDIIDLYHGPEPVLGQVLKGDRLLGDDATYARLLTKHLLNSADFLPLHQRILTERQAAWIR
ncbi:MAG: nucleotidyltransferase domain-containing protein [Pseudomonadales bacterium]